MKPKMQAPANLQLTKSYNLLKLTYAVRREKVRSSTHYRRLSTERGWPNLTTLYAKLGKVDWDVLLNHGKLLGKRGLTFQQLTTEVRRHRIRSNGHYKESSARHGWPVIDTLRKHKEFVNWDTFLNRKKFDFEGLRRTVQQRRIRSSKHYKEVAPRKGWPASQTLRGKKEFKGWDHFLGRKKYAQTLAGKKK